MFLVADGNMDEEILLFNEELLEKEILEAKNLYEFKKKFKEDLKQNRSCILLMLQLLAKQGIRISELNLEAVASLIAENIDTLKTAKASRKKKVKKAEIDSDLEDDGLSEKSDKEDFSTVDTYSV